MKVRFTPGGRDQLLAAVMSIVKDNPPAAVAFRRRVEKALRRLVRFPQSGRQVPEFPDLPFREVVVPPYRIFYRAQGTTVWVVAVWHGAQLPIEPGE